MDKLLFDCADGGGVLPPLLQLLVHQLAVVAALKDCTAVLQLRGHPNEPAGLACDQKTADKGDAAQGLQGSGDGSLAME